VVAICLGGSACAIAFFAYSATAAPLPEGFPPPTPEGQIEFKQYPAYRSATVRYSGELSMAVNRAFDSLKLEVPGIEAKDLDISVTQNAVSISGERKEETKTQENGVTKSEFYYGKFQRVIPLPARIQNTQVRAEYKDGILNLTLPKAESEKNKVVKVNLEQAA
jgi:HSP20 family protein